MRQDTHHEANVHLLVCARVQEDDLASSAFLSRCAEQDDRSRRLGVDQNLAEGEEDGQAGNGDEVVLRDRIGKSVSLSFPCGKELNVHHKHGQWQEAHRI